jgi:hypothetical protein
MLGLPRHDRIFVVKNREISAVGAQLAVASYSAGTALGGLFVRPVSFSSHRL